MPFMNCVESKSSLPILRQSNIQFFFRRGTHGGRRCANCRNADFLGSTVMKASSHGKTCKKNMKKKSDPCPQPGLSPDLAHGSELFGCFSFFGFLEVLAKLQKTMEKSKKVQTHVPSQASPQTLPMGLNFLFFCFFV